MKIILGREDLLPMYASTDVDHIAFDMFKISFCEAITADIIEYKEKDCTILLKSRYEPTGR